MKIALVNYRYFISGGPERYYFNIKEVLERHGHTIIPFSVRSTHNFPSEYDSYFIESVDDEVYFAQTRKTPATVLKSFSRMFYSFEAKRKFRQLLNDTKPDVVYIMQYHNKISPSIIDAAKSLGIPVVHRISDFQYMCPNALFYNDRTGVCEDCLTGHSLSCVKNRCVHNSLIYSTIKLAAKKLHDAMGVTKKIDSFIVPSSFTLGKLRQYGIPEEKLHHIPTFFNYNGQTDNISYEPYFVYIGRIEKQKGLETLIKAFVDTNLTLKIIGFSNDGYIDSLKSMLDGRQHNIQFLGRMTFDQIAPYLRSCTATIVPSEWYDNFPNSILESFAFSKAVIATDFGSLPELVEDGVTGFTFNYADHNSLRDKATFLISHPDEAKRMGQTARERIESRYSAEVHYNCLIKILNQVADNINK